LSHAGEKERVKDKTKQCELTLLPVVYTVAFMAVKFFAPPAIFVGK
jgi:hypothetical protein